MSISRRNFLYKSLKATACCCIAYQKPWYINNALAQKAQVIKAIRDAETETMLSELAIPLFHSAGINSDSFKSAIIVDRSLQASVSRGTRILFSTGMIQSLKNRDQIEAVLAHETGHIAAGHFLKLQDKFQKQQLASLLSILLAVPLGLATLRPEIGAAAAMIASDASRRSVLSFSRSLEDEADLYAVNLMLASGSEPAALVNALGEIHKRNALPLNAIDPYLLTHPLTTDRIQRTKEMINPDFYRKNSSRYYDVTKYLQNSSGLRKNTVDLERLKGKLSGYLNRVSSVPASPKKVEYSPKIYAHNAVQAMRLYNSKIALEYIAVLESYYLDDPFLHEMKGDALARGKQFSEAKKEFIKALEQLPLNSNITLSLLKTINDANIKTSDDQRLMSELVIPALDKDPQMVGLMQEIARYYHLVNMVPERELFLAESAFVLGRKNEAIARIKPHVNYYQKHQHLFARSNNILLNNSLDN